MKLFGVPVKIDVSFFVLAGLLAFSRASEPALLVVWLVVVLFSVLVHEFGHALAGRAFGLSPAITLYSMGGLTSFTQADSRLHPFKNLLISLAGPLTGLFVGAVVFLAGPRLLGVVESDVLAVAYADLLWVNIGWGLFNLLPVMPLDGGHIVSSIEEWITGRHETPFAHAVSLVLAAGLGLWALSAGWLWVAFLGGWFAFSNGSALWQLTQRKRDTYLQPKLAEARAALEARDFERAFELLAQLGREAKADSLKREAAWLLVYAHVREGDYERAEHDLNRYEALYGMDAHLRDILRAARGDAGGGAS